MTLLNTTIRNNLADISAEIKEQLPYTVGIGLHKDGLLEVTLYGFNYDAIFSKMYTSVELEQIFDIKGLAEEYVKEALRAIDECYSIDAAEALKRFYEQSYPELQSNDKLRQAAQQAKDEGFE